MKRVSWLILTVTALCAASLPAQAKYGGGTGKLNNPYLIYEPNHMQAIGADSNDWDKHFKLMADIDLSTYTGTTFNIIGTGTFVYGFFEPIFVSTPFTGTFDGNGYTISNFIYIAAAEDPIYCVGLFGVVDGANAEIKNLGLINATLDVDPGDRIGPLIGYLVSGTVTGCHAESSSVSGQYRVGGLVGDNAGTLTDCYAEGDISAHAVSGGLAGGNRSGGNYYGTISNCISSGSVSGNRFVGGLVGVNTGTISGASSSATVSGLDHVGGLIGYCQRGHVSNCYATGSVSGTSIVGGLSATGGKIMDNCYATGYVRGSSIVGGLVALNDGGAEISNCYATGDVEGDDDVGGLVGSNIRTVRNCYATGRVLGITNLGGLIGKNTGTVSGCFWDVNSSGLETSAGGAGKTTAQMRDPNTFIDAGWDFVGEYENGPSNFWAEPNNSGYPILWWQLSPLPALPTFSAGSGAADDPYLISTVEELNRIGCNPRLMRAHFKLINDVDLMETVFFTIGNKVYPFTGIFNGNDKTISNFTYISTDKDDIGFFGFINGPYAKIKDLNLRAPYIKAEMADSVGALVGKLEAGTITGCHVEQGNVSAKRYTGGLVGFNRNGTIFDCTSSGSVSGSGLSVFTGGGYIGGLVGSNSGIIFDSSSASSVISGDDGAVGGLVGRHLHMSNSDFEILNCYATGTVSGNQGVGGLVGRNFGPISNCASSASVDGSKYIGGLAGFNDERIRNCYSTGNVSGTTDVGGLVGDNRYKISNCYSTGSVEGNNNVGGLVGYQNNDRVTNSFWDIETSGQLNSNGGIGKTTHDMQTESTFTDAGWDFVGETTNGSEDIWFIYEDNDYPRLRWENGIPIADAGQDQTLYTWLGGFAEVTLDGSGSYDPDDDELTCLWSWTIDSDTYDADGVTPTIELPIGEHLIELVVSDGIDFSEPNEVIITVVPPIEAHLHILPQVINRSSRRPRILAVIRLPENVTKDQIDSNTPLVLYHGGIESVYQRAIQYNRRGNPHTIIFALFSKNELMGAVTDNGRVELEVIGNLKTGQYFYGSNTIRIINRRQLPRRHHH